MIYGLLKRMIEQDNYDNKEEFQTKLDTFYALNRITNEQYIELTKFLESKETIVTTNKGIGK
ncbi:hypothetical protein [Romboutsia hominis]|uniref:hypothetical protein n=1 Tax=Romboutsia hominis TaxID=1507512 RepID=UPI001FA75E66|nr:hypothetical protein [Romboutsia hominis]